MNNLIWHLKQLLPLSYQTHYMDSEQNVHFVVWRMWLGWQFAVTDVVVDCSASGHSWQGAMA
jgi:hypothetical protein